MPSVISTVERMRRLRRRLETARAHHDTSPLYLLRLQLLLLKSQQRIASWVPTTMHQHVPRDVRT